jgi:hypothetical protein
LPGCRDAEIGDVAVGRHGGTWLARLRNERLAILHETVKSKALPPLEVVTADEPASPPSIGYLKSMGVTAFLATCAHAHCLQSGLVSFDAAGVNDRAPFPSIVNRRRFVCTRCGGRAVNIMPDWRGYTASGHPRRQPRLLPPLDRHHSPSPARGLHRLADEHAGGGLLFHAPS